MEGPTLLRLQRLDWRSGVHYIHHLYAKTGEFWPPETNRSESKIRLGGSALRTIDDATSHFEDPHEMNSVGAAEFAARNRQVDLQGGSL